MKPTDPDPRRTPPGHGQHPFDKHHADHGHTDHDGFYNEDVAHEHSDVNVRSLLIFCLGMVAICAVVAVAMWGLFVVLEKQAAQNDPVMSPIARPAGQRPPEPRLLENEPQYLQTIKAGEREALEGYGWVDQQGGVVRIPIEEAKKRLLRDGLPVRAGATVEPWMGMHAAARGEASGGRGIPLRRGGAGQTQTDEKPAAPKSGGH